MDKRVDIFTLLKNEGKLTKVLFYVANTTIADPYEKNKTLNYMQSVPVDALVRDVSIEALAWKYYGNMPMGSKQIIVESKYLNLVKSSRRISIDGNYYQTYFDDSKGFAIIHRLDYIIIVAELKPINE